MIVQVDSSDLERMSKALHQARNFCFADSDYVKYKGLDMSADQVPELWEYLRNQQDLDRKQVSP